MGPIATIGTEDWKKGKLKTVYCDGWINIHGRNVPCRRLLLKSNLAEGLKIEVKCQKCKKTHIIEV